MSAAPAQRMGPGRVAALTSLALVAFAANSILCRLALGQGRIDAASFTTIRLAAGVLALVALVTLRPKRAGAPRATGDWLAATMLFLYAAAFSFAYLSLDAGVGALILFGAVQATMIVAALARGDRPRSVEWLGLVVALAGLTHLVRPGLDAPSPWGAALMAAAGAAWGLYTLRGAGMADPLVRTRDNFVYALPLGLALSALAWDRFEISIEGLGWAALSGSVTSGAGYAVWYTALRGLTATRAAIVQLSVPVLAAVGGILLLGERPTWRLGVAAVLILGGVGLALSGRRRAAPPAARPGTA